MIIKSVSTLLIPEIRTPALCLSTASVEALVAATVAAALVVWLAATTVKRPAPLAFVFSSFSSFPLASELLPLVSEILPLASELFPLVSEILPLASELFPLASEIPPLTSLVYAVPMEGE